MNIEIGRPHRDGDPRANDFSLGEVSGDSLQEDVPDRQAISREKYVADWGVRVSDNALVLHFFPPLTAEGKISEDWDYTYEMDKRLERAIPSVFDVSRVTAGFEKEYNSFFIIVGGGGSVLDVRLFVQRFLDAVDLPLSPR